MCVVSVRGAFAWCILVVLAYVEARAGFWTSPCLSALRLVLIEL